MFGASKPGGHRQRKDEWREARRPCLDQLGETMTTTDASEWLADLDQRLLALEAEWQAFKEDWDKVRPWIVRHAQEQARRNRDMTNG